MSNYFLLTGGTGLVGRYLLRDLLTADAPVAVLIRSRKDQSAEERLDQVLLDWESQLRKPLPRPVCLEGDLNKPGLGLDSGQEIWIQQNVNSVIHNGASLTFQGKDRNKDPWLSNYQGTANVLEMCRENNIRHFHYVSTAYVCGKCPGPVYEKHPHVNGYGFRNDYEESKYAAEQMVRNADWLDCLTIHRPATIVGDSQTGYTSTYHGFYAYLQFAWVLSNFSEKDSKGRWEAPLRMNLTGNEPRNLVPVDWVSSVMVEILLNSKHHGHTYHLAPTDPVTMLELDAVMSEYLNYYGTTFVGPEGLKDKELNSFEKNFYDSLMIYLPYRGREPVFDCTNTIHSFPHLPCPKMDRDVLKRIMDFAIKDRWGKNGGKIRAKKAIMN